MPVRGELVALQERAGAVGLDGRPLDVEKDERLPDARVRLADALEERAPGGVLGVRAPREVGVGVGPPRPVVDVGELGERRGEVGGAQVGDAAAEAGGKVGGLGLGRFQVGVEVGLGGVEVVERPADVFGAGRGRGGLGHGGVGGNRGRTRVGKTVSWRPAAGGAGP